MELISGKKGVKGKSKNSDITLKTQINFVGLKKEKTTNWILLIPGTILIIVFAVLFSRFAVVGRFSQLSAAQANLRSLQDEMAADTKLLSTSGELTDTFYHYTWSDMTDEEKERISRLSVIELIEFISGKGVVVNSLRVSGNAVDLTVITTSMDKVSELSKSLSEREIVESVSVTNVTKQQIEDAVTETGAVVKGGVVVDAQLRVYLKTKSEILGEGEE